MKTLICLLFMFFAALPVMGQSGISADLKQKHATLLQATTDTARVSAYVDIGHRHILESYDKRNTKALDSAIYYMGLAEKLNSNINFKKGQAYIYTLSSRIYKVKGQFDKAEEQAQKAVDIITQTGTKTEQADAYTFLAASAVEVRKPAQSIVYFEMARKYYKESGNKFGEASALLNVAYMRSADGKLEQSITELEECLALFKSIDYKQIQRVYSLLAIANNRLGKYDKALEYGLQGVRVVDELNDKGMATAELYKFMGVIYSNLGELDKTYTYFSKALALGKNFNYEEFVSDVEGSLVTVLIQLKRYKEAQGYLKSLETKYKNLRPGVKEQVVVNSINAYMNIKNFTAAAKYLPDVYEILETFPKTDYRRSRYYSLLSDYHFRSGNYDESRKWITADQKLNEKIKNPGRLQEIHHMLFRLDSVKSDYESSIAHLKTQQAYKDSLFSLEKSAAINKLQIEYDTEKKNKELLIKDKSNRLLKKQAELQQSRLSQATLVRNVSLAGIVLLFVIIGFIYRRYLLNQRIRREINLKNSTLQSLLNEKEWLLKEIHHRVKNNLQIVMSLLNTQSHFLSDAAAKAAIKNSQHRIHSMSLIHKKLYQSDNVVSINMQVYINELIEYFKQSFDTGQRIRFEADIEPIELKTSQAVPLGLILNEAIINAIKHAFPADREGLISITLKNTSLNNAVLTIKDNGVGMDSNPDDKTLSSLGLKLINGFSGELDGHLAFVNNSGLTICLEFGINKTLVKENLAKESA
ncbi:hypothetical protein FMM05_02460 [Flavobacterium zepuense]|uniref:histidine kinase n=1 Tax=Flavobacterium zepuense TaxID=2593302 RepID=A0A552VAL3_9FLAO|nr:sensor histidine kinase [Flavobacterium zepuense]TRW27523.1 hypothetical protein FMM05_02460 [Flavobacterium zepuense]